MQGISRLEQVNGPVDDQQNFIEMTTPAGDDAAESASRHRDRHQGSDDMTVSLTGAEEALRMETEDDEIESVAAPALPPVDVSQFEAIFERFQTPISNYLYRLVGN